MSQLEQIQAHLHTLRMPTAVEIIGSLLQTATRETWPLETFLAELLEQEVEGRSQRRIERLQKSSHLPAGKTLGTFDHIVPMSFGRPTCPCALSANWPNSAPANSSPAPKTCWSLVYPALEKPISPPP